MTTQNSKSQSSFNTSRMYKFSNLTKFNAISSALIGISKGVELSGGNITALVYIMLYRFHLKLTHSILYLPSILLIAYVYREFQK